jgi:uncharacterized lipoprotein NlpE involved in copper resistance
MDTLKIDRTGNNITIKFNADDLDPEFVASLVKRLQLEYMVQKAQFSDEILKIADEIKADWWKNNKEKFLSGGK